MKQDKFYKRGSEKKIELGKKLAPKFDKNGLIPCITVDAESKEVLMFAWMNEKALLQTIQTGKATYYSRSRKKLWVKGESSGLSQIVQQILVDCDQDAIQLRVQVQGEGSCHQGFRSCFYRQVSDSNSLELSFTIKERSFDPVEVYKKK